MWLSLIMALLAYLLQNPKNAEERKRALIGAAAAGAITYGVTEYTDWGQENLKPFDDDISDFITGDKQPGVSTGSSTTGTGSKPPDTTGSGSSSIWDTLTSWGPAGTAAVVGVGAGTLTGNKSLLIGGAALLILFLLK